MREAAVLAASRWLPVSLFTLLVPLSHYPLSLYIPMMLYIHSHPQSLTIQTNTTHFTNKTFFTPAPDTSASGSPRPLSKVRTSFVAIADKDGRIGLHRQPSGDSSISERKLSGDTDAASSILLDSSRSNVLTSSPDTFRSERNRGPSGSFSRAALRDAGAGAGAGPTSAAPATTSPSSGPVPGPAATVAEPKASGAATTPGSVPASARSIADPSAGASTTTGSVSNSSLASGWSQKGLAASPQIRKAPRGEEAASQRAGTGKPGQGVQESEAQSARDQGQASAKGGENTLDRGVNKDRSSGGAGGTVGNAVAGTTALNGADKAKTVKLAPAASTQPKTAGKAPETKGNMTPATEKKPTDKKATTANASPPFVKPRPKSPTQPIKLPERLTTHTGASAAKSKNAPPPVRPASRTSMGTSGRALGRSSSVTGRQHSSFGPPPKQAVDHPVLKKESKVDEGFLARMMRPTQAYANKVADKVQLPPKTPPRATATKKPASIKTGPVRRGVPKSTTTSAAASPETSKSEPALAVKQAAKKQDSIAEEPIVAKKMEEKPAPAKSVAPAEKKEILKASEQKTDLPKAKEAGKVNLSKPAEKENIAKVAEAKKEAPKANDQTETISKASTKEDNASKSLGRKDKPSKSSEKEEFSEKSDYSKPTTPDERDESSKISDKTSETTSGLQASSESKNDISKTTEDESFGSDSSEKPEPTLKSSKNATDDKKSSDAMLEAFMNPGSEKTDISQANGNHRDEDKTNGSLGKSEADKSSIQPKSNNNLAGGPQQPSHSTSSNSLAGLEAEQLASGTVGTAPQASKKEVEEVEEW